MINILNKYGLLRLDELVTENPTWKKIMADDIVSEEEVAEQGDKVINMIKGLEETLTEKQRHKLDQLIAEVGVLYSAHHLYTAQQLLKMNRAN